jgi:hypothetical protein
MSEKVQVGGNGIGFGSMLALLFIGLKLGGVINWSWWWILCPLWIPIALVVAILGAILVGAVAVGMIEAISKKH